MRVSIKEGFFGISYIAVASTSFWLWRGAIPLIIDGEFREYVQLVAPLVGLVLAGVLFWFVAVFAQNFWMRYLPIVLGAAVPFYLGGDRSETFWFLGASVFLFIVAAYRIHKDYELMQGFSVSKLARSGIPLFFTAGSIVISVFYFMELDQEKAVSSLFPRGGIDFVLERMSGTLASSLGLPALKPDSTISGVLGSLVLEQLKSQGVDTGLVPKKELERLISLQQKQFSEQLGVTLKGQEKVSDVLYSSFVGRLRDLLGPYEKYLPVTSAVIFFFALKTFTFPLYFLALFGTFVLLNLFIWFKVLKKEKKQIEVEKLVYG